MSAQHHSHPPRISPLELPEILHSVFEHLAQNHLHSAVQVSKLWHSIATSRIIVTVRWDESMGEPQQRQLFSERFARASVLHCTFGQYFGSTKEITAQARNQLTTCLASLKCAQGEFLDDNCNNFDRSIQSGRHGGLRRSGGHGGISSLVLKDMYDLEDFHLGPFWVLAPTLTKIDIANCGGTSFPLDTLLDQFPNLESLSMVRRLDFNYGESESVLTFHDRWSLLLGFRNLPRLQLQTLKMTGFRCDLVQLLGLLKSCPDLKELKLLAFNGIFPGIQQQYQCLMANQYEAARETLELIKSVCSPHLRSIHLSDRNIWMPLGVLEVMNEIWPNVLDSIVIPAHTLFGRSYPTGLTNLQSRISPMLNYVTTLDLTSRTNEGNQFHPEDQRGCMELQRFLCRAPLLKHLKARVLPFHILMANGQRVAGDPPGSVWACRDLQTLEIRITNLMFEADKNGVKRAQEDSRTFFAYLVHVCPKLKEIWLARSKLRLDLEGGLCLLSGLKDLEKLVIFSTSQVGLEWRDLEWMSARKERAAVGEITDQPRAGWDGALSAVKDWLGASLWKKPTATAAACLDEPATVSKSTDLTPIEEQPSVPLSQDIHAHIDWSRTMNGVMQTAERLKAAYQEDGGTFGMEKRCWPRLEVLWLRTEVPIGKRKRALEMIECLRPDLRYQVKPAPLEKSG